MKYLHLITILLFVYGCNNPDEVAVDKQLQSTNDSLKDVPQISGADSLEKYSYELIPLINGVIDGTKNGGATGFFIRQNNRLFLVSAYHVFTLNNTANKQKNSTEKYDTLAIRYKKIGEAIFSYDTIDIREIKKKNPPVFYYEYPDIYAYEIKLPSNAIINTINSFIDTAISSRIKEKYIVSYGYPSDSNKPTGMYFKFLTPIYQDSIQISPDGKIFLQLKNSYIVKPESVPGMSGAPVFINYNKEINNVQINKTIFGGVISTHANGNTVVVKPTELYILLKRKGLLNK